MAKQVIGGFLVAIVPVFAAMSAHGQVRGRGEDEVVAAFLNQEKEVWELEGKLLREAMAAIEKAPERRLGEIDLRRIIRNGRSSATLKQVRGFVNEHLQPASIDLLKEIAETNGVEPEDVFADYLTVEATIDYSLMASAYATVHGNNLDQFPDDARRLLERLVDGVKQAPVPTDDIEVGKLRGDRLAINVFGCDINEQVTKVDVGRRDATLTWKSNYTFLRDLKDRVPPKETREETLLDDDGKWTISYEREIQDFVGGAGRTEWGKKVKELANIGNYLERKDPLDRSKSRREQYVYDPEADDSPEVHSFSGKKVADKRLSRDYDEDDDQPARRR